MNKLIFALASATILAGCATSPTMYAGNPQAVAQSMAVCRAQSDGVAVSAMGGGGLMFAAAMQQQYVNDCMAATGHPIE